MEKMIQEITIASSPDNVYNALVEQDKLSSWWTHSVKAEPKVGTTAEFGFYGGQVVFKMDVTDLQKGKSVTWKCSGGPPEWVGTDLTFSIKENEGVSILRFTHGNWKTTENSFGMVNYQWALYLKSLKDFLETGKGEPNTT